MFAAQGGGRKEGTFQVGRHTFERLPSVRMNCSKCGAEANQESLQRGSCEYCGTVLPHVVRAAEKAAQVQALLADRDGNGVPDVLENLHQVQPTAVPSPPASKPALPNWVISLILTVLIVGLAAFFIAMQLATEGRLADP